MAYRQRVAGDHRTPLSVEMFLHAERRVSLVFPVRSLLSIAAHKLADAGAVGLWCLTLSSGQD